MQPVQRHLRASEKSLYSAVGMRTCLLLTKAAAGAGVSAEDKEGERDPEAFALVPFDEVDIGPFSAGVGGSGWSSNGRGIDGRSGWSCHERKRG
mgnify:CR=1 FL=1|jgi:hypothetical protein